MPKLNGLPYLRGSTPQYHLPFLLLHLGSHSNPKSQGGALNLSPTPTSRTRDSVGDYVPKILEPARGFISLGTESLTPKNDSSWNRRILAHEFNNVAAYCVFQAFRISNPGEQADQPLRFRWCPKFIIEHELVR